MIFTASSTQFVIDTQTIPTTDILSVGYSTLRVQINFKVTTKASLLIPYSSITTYNNSTVIPTFPDLITELKGYVTASQTTTQSNTITVLSLPGVSLLKGDKGDTPDISGKVDKVTGYGLSKNDLSDTNKSHYDTAYSHSQTAHAPSNAVSLATVKSDTQIALAITDTHAPRSDDQDLSGLVVKVTGKGLSANDYTDSDKNRLANTSGTNTGDQDLSGKVDKISGKGLSANDYSDSDKNRLSNTSGTNTGDQTLPTKLSDLSDDTTHRVVTDSEKSTWNGKSALALGETSTTAYAGDKGKTAYDHSQSAHAPSNAVALATVKSDTQIATAISQSHAAGSDNQDLSGLVSKIAGYSLVPDASIALIHAAHSDDQDLSGYSLTSHNHTGIYEPANSNIQTHVTSPHAPANAQKNSDILKSEVEAVLTGNITSHTHTTPPIFQFCNIQSADTVIAAGYSVYIPEFYEIASGINLEIGLLSTLEIG